jgi:hypothetical protein
MHKIGPSANCLLKHQLSRPHPTQEQNCLAARIRIFRGPEAIQASRDPVVLVRVEKDVLRSIPFIWTRRSRCPMAGMPPSFSPILLRLSGAVVERHGYNIPLGIAHQSTQVISMAAHRCHNQPSRSGIGMLVHVINRRARRMRRGLARLLSSATHSCFVFGYLLPAGVFARGVGTAALSGVMYVHSCTLAFRWLCSAASQPARMAVVDESQQGRVLGQLREGPEDLRLNLRDECRPAAAAQWWRRLKRLPFGSNTLHGLYLPHLPHSRRDPSRASLPAAGESLNLTSLFLGPHLLKPPLPGSPPKRIASRCCVFLKSSSLRGASETR